MDLNRLGAGKKLIQEIMAQGNLRNMRWTKTQQKEALDKQKNPHTVKTRHLSKPQK